MLQDKPVRVDAKTFQHTLGKLGEALVQQVFREGDTHAGLPRNVCDDIAMMLRYSLSVYHLLFYLNADVRRREDTDWRIDYGVTAMFLVRSLIDCLYNITAILDAPREAGPAYRKSGMQKILKDLDEDQAKYGGQPNWDAYITQRRKAVETLITMSGFTLAEVQAQHPWRTLGKYLSQLHPGGSLTPHQQFLKTFTHLGWRQYSALSHGAYEAFSGTMGHVPVGAYYVTNFLPHENRPKVEESYDISLSSHMARAATVLLSIVTELQAYCRFQGHQINERICEVWAALIPLFEAKELYDGRYEKLMAERGISTIK